MARELVKSPRGNSDVEKYTSDRLDGLFNKALQDIQTAFTFGYKRDLILAQSFANIKRGRLYKAKFKTFEEFVVAIGFNLSSADRYAQLGEGLREGVRRMKGDGKEIRIRQNKVAILKYQRDAYQSIAKEIRLGYHEIGRRAGTTDTTAKSVLVQREGHFFSKATEARVLAVIEQEVEHLRDALNRLSGGEVG